MIYLDNIIFSLQRHGGVSVLWGKLINSLLKLGMDVRFMDYKNANCNEIRKQITIPSEFLITNTNLPIAIERYLRPKISNSDKFIFHSSHYRISNNMSAINVTTVHDFTYERFFSGIQRKIHMWQKYKAINNSDMIICISENTKRDLLNYLPDIPEDKIRVVYNGVSEDYKPLNYINDKYSDFILFVGGRQSYKNFNFAASCAKAVKKKLLIVGAGLSFNEMEFLNNNLGQHNYLNIVHPNNDELNNIYNSVFCLLYPSLYEGFGIPVIEAQKAGCPVIAMNSSSIPEIIGNGGILLSNSNLDEFKSKFQTLSDNRDNLVRAGIENAKRFSWEKMTDSYINIYKELQNNA